MGGGGGGVGAGGWRGGGKGGKGGEFKPKLLMFEMSCQDGYQT